MTSEKDARRHAAMMASGSGQPVMLIAGEKTSAGETRVQRWDRPARIRRAAKIWAGCWAAAALSVLIPVAHFLLVPAFFLAGPIVAFSRWRQVSSVLGGDGACPACGAPMWIAENADEWPLFQLCESCRTTIRIEKSGPPPG